MNAKAWRLYAAGDARLEDIFLFAAVPALITQWAVAAGSAACTMPGGAPPSVSLVDGLFNRE